MNARTATDLDLIHSKMRKRASGLYSWANQNKQYPALGNYMAYSNNSPTPLTHICNQRNFTFRACTTTNTNQRRLYDTWYI